MHTKQDILETLRRLKGELQEQYGVESLALVGSFVRNEAREGSDIDVFITLKKPTFNSLMGVQETLEAHFETGIDVICDGKHLRDSFRQTVVREALYV